MAAGFDRTTVLGIFDDSYQRSWLQFEDFSDKDELSDKEIEELDLFLDEITENRSLQELCRDAIGKHLMSIHPDTNLFCLMPKLFVPGHFWMNAFLLYDIKL